jgi:hypothetical protein
LRKSQNNEQLALEKVKSKYLNLVEHNDMHFFLGTTRQFHGFSPNPWLIIWGYTEGDIYAAYCANTFPKVKTFTHNGQLYANMGGGDLYCTCFPLVPPDLYQGPPGKPHTYEGASVTFKGQGYSLGTKTIFASRKWTLGESVELLRRKYAYGGHFASQKSYRQVLLAFLSRQSNSPQMKTAIESELNQPS